MSSRFSFFGLVLIVLLIQWGYDLQQALDISQEDKTEGMSSVNVQRIGITSQQAKDIQDLFKGIWIEPVDEAIVEEEVPKEPPIIIKPLNEQQGLVDNIQFPDFRLTLVSIIKTDQKFFALFDKKDQKNNHIEFIEIENNTLFENLTLNILSFTKVTFTSDTLQDGISLQLYPLE